MLLKVPTYDVTRMVQLNIIIYLQQQTVSSAQTCKTESSSVSSYYEALASVPVRYTARLRAPYQSNSKGMAVHY